MLISFAIVVSPGWKNTQRTTREPSAPLAGFQAPLTGRFWVPADNLVSLSLDECSIGILTSCLANTHDPVYDNINNRYIGVPIYAIWKVLDAFSLND